MSMQWGRTGLAQIRFGLRLAVSATLVGLPYLSASAQTIVRPGLTLDVLEQPYTISGSSARALLAQLVTLGPPGLTSFPYFFEWSYGLERIERAFGGLSQQCLVSSFTIAFDITKTYPEWERPSDASQPLVDAWESFQDLVDQQWEQREREVIDFGVELRRRALRVEAGCPLAAARLQELVYRMQEERAEVRREAAQGGQLVQLEWPPPGFSELSSSATVVAEARPARPKPAAPSTPPGPSEPTVPAIYNDLEGALNADLRVPGTLQVVAGLDHLGERQYLNAFVTSNTSTVDMSIPFRGFTDVLVGLVASALEAEGSLDLQAPLSSYLPDLDTRLGRLQIDQLLAHRSGLDNAVPPDSTGWSEVMDDLDDRALFTEPGAVFSYSMYGYPLVTRAIESVTGKHWIDVVRELLLEPLGMESTSIFSVTDGLPITTTTVPDGLAVTTTTAPDLLRFVDGLLHGGLPGVFGFPVPTSSELAPRGGIRVFYGGVWHDYVGGEPRVSLTCARRGRSYAAGFQVFPATNTAFVLGSPRWPEHTARFLTLHLASQIGVGVEIFQPIGVKGSGSIAARRGPPCSEPGTALQMVREPGPVAVAGEWPGRYTNGDRMFVLEEQDGTLTMPIGQPLGVAHYSTDVYFATLQGRAIAPFRLITDARGRRYMVVDHRAYIHDDDRPVG